VLAIVGYYSLGPWRSMSFCFFCRRLLFNIYIYPFPNSKAQLIGDLCVNRRTELTEHACLSYNAPIVLALHRTGKKPAKSYISWPSEYGLHRLWRRGPSEYAPYDTGSAPQL
jgi:hypothetical protein